MKHVIIEGGDRLGKSSLIKGICAHFNYDNITIRHFGKPKKGLTPEETFKLQFEAFEDEALLVDRIEDLTELNDWMYYPNIVIWNRSHLGEYVYSQMYRGIEEKIVRDRLLAYETTSSFNPNIPHLITLTADPYFFFLKEDGKSLSKSLEEKTKELELFKKAHELSKIRHKLLIDVTQESVVEGLSAHVFRSKKNILKEVLNFIDNE